MPPQFKKRKLNPSKTEEVVFDPSARFEYLTGFHKRKVERAKHAQEAALRRAREDKIQERKRLREERKEDLERHLQEVNALLPSRVIAQEHKDNSDRNEEDDWSGIADPEPVPVDHEDEYIDEDKYTTVTVEEVDISRNGLTKLKEPDEEEQMDVTAVEADIKPEESSTKSKSSETGKTGEKRKLGKPKRKKKRDFKYESKADRKFNHLKVRAKKSKLAKARRDG